MLSPRKAGLGVKKFFHVKALLTVLTFDFRYAIIKVQKTEGDNNHD